MATNFPTALDDFTNPTAGTSQNTARTHSQQHSDLNDAVEALQREVGTTSDPKLARTADLSGASGAGGIGWAQPGGVAQSVLDELRRIVRPEHHGADPTGVALSDTAFAACAELGKEITLTPGATYYLSARVSGVTGTKFVCAGECTVKIKTGTGGFAHINFNTLKDENSVFYFYEVDDVAVSGVRFTTDGVAEACIYPVRVRGGLGTKGGTFERLRFKGLSAIGGGYLSINSAGAGGYRVRDVEAADCGTAQDGTYWTGTPQITVFEIDNDMISSVASEPGYGEDIRGINVLMTGAALTAYGQETDVVNVAGISGTDRKGPTIHNIYGKGVGEVVDTFGSFGSYTGIRGFDVRSFVIKAVHGARGNYFSGVVESCGLAAVTFAGSSSVAVHTADNVVDLHTVRGVGDDGAGPTTANIPVVLIQENGGAITSCLPRNNVVTIHSLLGGANLDHVARDNCSVSNSNNNLVRLMRGSGWSGKFSETVHASNMKARNLSAQPCRLTMAATQTLSTGTAATIAFDTVASDTDALYAGSSIVRAKYPGWYQVRAQVRISGGNAADYVTLRIKRHDGASFVSIAQKAAAYGTGSVEVVFDVSQSVYVNEAQAGTASADFLIEATHTGAATVTAMNTATMSFFEVLPLPG